MWPRQCSQRGSPSVLGAGGDGRRVPSRSVFFPNLPCNSPPKTRAPLSPGEISHSCRPCRHLQSSAVPLLSQRRNSPAITLSFPLVFVLFIFMRRYYVYYSIVSFVFGVLPCHFSFLYDNSVRIDGTGDGNVT